MKTGDHLILVPLLRKTTTMDIQQEFESEFKEILKNQRFKDVPGSWYGTAYLGMQFASTLKLGITAKEFKEIIVKLYKHQELNCYEFALVNNNLESCSAHQLGMSLAVYAEFMDDVAGILSARWNNQVKDYRASLIHKLETQQKMLSAAARKQPAPTNHLRKT